MNKRVTTLIVSICLIIIILSLFVAIPKENWSVMPYILAPLLVACLLSIVFNTIHLIKKTPEIKEQEDKQEDNETANGTKKQEQIENINNKEE